MNTTKPRVASVLVAAGLTVGALVGVSACSTSAATAPTAGNTANTQTLDAVVLDVRTPAEFASGHLQGARNIDVSAPNFDAAVSALPTSGTYVVYCRSGNRSAAATSAMQELGFTNVTDAGSIQTAAETTGLPVVSG